MLLAAVLLFCGRSLTAAGVGPLTAGPERQLTDPGPLVAVSDVRLLALPGEDGDLAFWSDPRHGSAVFFSDGPTTAPKLSGEPFRPLETFAPELQIVPVAGQYLMIVRSDSSGLGFFALPLGLNGEPLRERPERIWSPNLHASFELASRGSDALIVWSEGYSIRTLQVDREGKLLEWSAPAEDFAGRIIDFDVARVDDGYLLVVSVTAGPGLVRYSAIPLAGDGRPVGSPVLLFESPHSSRFQLAGGDSRALLIYPDEDLHALLLESSGAVARSDLLASGGPGVEYYGWKVSVGERSTGWTVAWSYPDAGQPRILSVLEVDSSGQAGPAAVLPLDGSPSQILVGAGDSPLIGLTALRDSSGSETMFLRRAPGGEWSRSTISSRRPQRLAQAAASGNQMAVLWRQSLFPSVSEPRHLTVVDESGAREIPTDFTPAAVAAAADRFFISSVEPVDALNSRLTGSWLDDGGDLSDPIVIAENYMGALVQEWTGEQLLSFWSNATPFKLILIHDDIYVSSVFPSGATTPRLFWVRHRASMQDADCDDSGCFAAWNEVDYTNYCDFCSVPSRALVGRITRSGDLAGEPAVLADEARGMNFVSFGGGRLIISRGDGLLRATPLTPAGSLLEPVRLGAIPDGSQSVTASLGEAAVVVWELDGDIVGRVVTPELPPGPLTHVAASHLPETAPRLVVLNGNTWLLYERIDEAAGHVPRLFMRRLSFDGRRRAIGRP